MAGARSVGHFYVNQRIGADSPIYENSAWNHRKIRL